MIRKFFNAVHNIGLGIETTNSTDCLTAMAGIFGIGLMTGNSYVAAAGFLAFTAGAMACHDAGQERKALIFS